MAESVPRRSFRISRDTVFWILAAAAMIVLGVVLDVLWGGL